MGGKFNLYFLYTVVNIRRRRINLWG